MHQNTSTGSARHAMPACKRFTKDQNAAASLVVTIAGISVAAGGLLAWFLAGVLLVAIGGNEFVTTQVQVIGWLVIVVVVAIVGAGLYSKFGGSSE